MSPLYPPLQALSPTAAPSPVAALNRLTYTADDRQRVTKLYLEGPRERLLKARLPDLCYGTLHMECYHFCQQCEDHFDTTGATDSIKYPLQPHPFVVGSQATS